MISGRRRWPLGWLLLLIRRQIGVLRWVCAVAAITIEKNICRTRLSQKIGILASKYRDFDLGVSLSAQAAIQ